MAASETRPVLPPGLSNGLLFFAVVIAGSGYIIFSKLNDFGAFAVTSVPVLIMIGYAVLLGARLFRLRDDQSGDNLYYMGFLFTLTSPRGIALSVFRRRLGRADRAEFRYRDRLDHRRHYVADPVQPDAARSGRSRSHGADGTGRSLAAGEARTGKRHPGIRLFPAHDPAIRHRRAGRGAGKHRPGASGIYRRIEKLAQTTSSPFEEASRRSVRDARRPERKDSSGARGVQAIGAGRRTARQEHRAVSSRRSTTFSPSSHRSRPRSRSSRPSWRR